MDDESTVSLTEGNLVRPMTNHLVPILAMGLLQTSYNFIDIFWLGRWSTNAVGAISLAFPVIFLILSLGSGFVVAGSALVSQYVGAGHETRASKMSGQTLLLVGITSVVLGGFGYAFAGTLFEVIPTQSQTASDVVPLVTEFMRVFFVGLPTLLLFSAFSAIMRGYGDTRTPMYIMAASITINVVLDPLLIFGTGPIPEFGISGAAIATVVARGVAVVVGLALLFLSSYGPDVDLVHLGPDLADLYELLRIGTPSSIEDASTSLAILTVALFVASFPPAVVVAYGVGTRVLSFVQMVGGAFGQTTNTTVGQNLGAGQPERTRRAIRLAGVGVSGVMVALAVLVAVFAEPISRLFLVDSSAQTAMAVDHSVTYLRVLAVGFVFSGIFETVLGAYRGAGSTRTALGFSLVALWVGRVLVVVVLTAYVGMDAMGIWVGMITSSVVGSIVASLWMARGTWMDAVIEERSVA